MNPVYDFPVSLQNVYTKDGSQVPRIKAVVRDDSKKAIAAVSTKYALIEHRLVMDQAMKFVEKLGQPVINFHSANDGARIVGEFTYRDHTFEVEKNDLVGMRVYVENTYNAKGSLKVRLGGLRLVCLNGMVRAQDVFNLDIRHIGEPDITFPDPDIIFDRFNSTMKDFRRLTEIDLTEEEYRNFGQAAKDDGVITEKSLSAIDGKDGSAWSLYNDFTYHINHMESAKATQIGKLNRLNRVSSWFDDKFPVH